ncbi:MAG: Rieske 2Fe-2S domain-containing protein [Pseudomonadota bacterium]
MNVADRADLDASGRLAVEIDGVAVGVFKTRHGVFAVEDACPHGLGKLSSGRLSGREIECPLHNAAFDLASGVCTFGGPWTLRRYAVATNSNGRLLLRPLSEEDESQRSV